MTANESDRRIEGGVDDNEDAASPESNAVGNEMGTVGSLSSSQLLSGPACSTGGAWGASQGRTSGNFSIETGLSNDESYFILDEGGRHVLDDQGSPARARKWQPTNATQRARYTRLHLATKGASPTCRWLPSVLISPDHLNIPRTRAHKKSKAVKGVGLGSVHAFTPGADGMAATCNGDGGGHFLVGAESRREMQEQKKRRQFLAEERRRTHPKQLDGFMLMDACGCDLPDEGRGADVSGRGLVGAVQEDLSYFVRLQTLDAGDNSMSFDSFTALRQLEELRIPCNNIRDVAFAMGDYVELRRLDLSYNNLSSNALSMLIRLPNLTDLDLTCNSLTTLPATFGHHRQLQKLSLERNQLESYTTIDVLSTLPALRELNLAFNYFTSISLKPEIIDFVFPLLEALDLGFNYVGNESDVVDLVLLDKLQRIILYGNPLVGPTGEDPLGLCVEGLIDKADRVREGWASHPIEVITEMPRAKQMRGDRGERGRRRRPYGDMGLTMVDEGYLPSATAFRDAGNRSLFSFEPPKREEVGDTADNIVEATLRLAREQSKRQFVGGGKRAEPDLTFMTGVEREDDNEVENIFGAGVADNLGGLGHEGGMSSRLLRRPVDPIVRGDPVKLRMAFTALRYALKHPVSSSMDVPPKRDRGTRGDREEVQGRNGVGSHKSEGGVGRKTAAARARQLPRRPYHLLKSQRGFSMGLFDDPSQGVGRGGGDLSKVDEVLTSMGVGVSGMALEKRAKQGDLPHQPRRIEKPQLSSIIRTVNEVLDEHEY